MVKERYEIKVTGVVQGVGFRPFVYTLAKSLGLTGWICNTSEGVIIDIEGGRDAVDCFLERLEKEAPPLAKIKNVSVQKQKYVGYADFKIKQSIDGNRKDIYISPDVSICDDCKRELFDPNDRRYLYPFINCTNCGPRFTIIRDVPYDRINTTMAKFPMCPACAGEYAEPLDRRYHAQPVACHECGPELTLLDNSGRKVEAGDVISHIRNLISNGKIVAVKGLGGYHLACDAWNSSAVRELRRRKNRDDKPFALMVKDFAITDKLCYIDEEEKRLLESYKRPIVLLKKKEGNNLPEDIAPGNPYLGLMLPYTPVHLLLFYYPEIGNMADAKPFPDTLVMTSANISSEPICYRDEEALEKLSGIADYFLTNNRDIYIRTDDSVTRVFRGREYIIRRSRGYVPMPVTLENMEEIIGFGKNIPSVLACGGELKNTFCMNKGREFYLSHHIGDLENVETLESFEEGIRHFKRMFNIEYDTAAYDLHPEYLSTKYVMSLDLKNKIPVQHHHAHIASCMAENGLNGDLIGVAFDGTGYGEDGNIWGGEFFTGSYKGFRRAGHLEYTRMPGGEMAVREPWRMALSYLHKLSSESGKDVKTIIKECDLFKNTNESKISAVVHMVEKGINSPFTSSMGRLFDAVSALLSVRERINYEGQAAIELEYIARDRNAGSYEFVLKDTGDAFEVHTGSIIEGVIKDIKEKKSKAEISSKFHNTVAEIILQGCSRIKSNTGLNRVVLSGGVFQNMTLLEKSVDLLEGNGFEVYTHSIVPSNDGGISLGQAVMAIARTS